LASAGKKKGLAKNPGEPIKGKKIKSISWERKGDRCFSLEYLKGEMKTFSPCDNRIGRLEYQKKNRTIVLLD